MRGKSGRRHSFVSRKKGFTHQTSTIQAFRHPQVERTLTVVTTNADNTFFVSPLIHGSEESILSSPLSRVSVTHDPVPN